MTHARTLAAAYALMLAAGVLAAWRSVVFARAHADWTEGEIARAEWPAIAATTVVVLVGLWVMGRATDQGEGAGREHLRSH